MIVLFILIRVFAEWGHGKFVRIIFDIFNGFLPNFVLMRAYFSFYEYLK